MEKSPKFWHVPPPIYRYLSCYYASVSQDVAQHAVSPSVTLFPPNLSTEMSSSNQGLGYILVAHLLVVSYVPLLWGLSQGKKETSPRENRGRLVWATGVTVGSPVETTCGFSISAVDGGSQGPREFASVGQCRGKKRNASYLLLLGR